jgi:GMP synthase (glutamine-hydrolysing)
MRVLALTHGPSVGPGVFAEAVREAGHALVERRVPVAGARREEADAVLVFGGALLPDEDDRHGWLRPELSLLAALLEEGIPLFGVCLGAQLIARAAGAEVLRAPDPEVGWVPVELTEAGRGDPVVGSLPRRFDALEWHHYTYELPAGAVELARSSVCTQAFQLGRAWAVQFHPEVHGAQVESWLAEEPSDASDPERLRTETRVRIAAWNDLGRTLCGAFLAEASR